MIVVAILFSIGVIMEFYTAASAPFGYQDERGFHVGMERR
jgi:hypothetical protein